MRRTVRLGCISSPLLIVFLTLTAWAFRTQLLAAAANILIEDDGIQKADLILVLGGDNFGDRTMKAAALATQGYAPYVLVSGPPRLVGYDSDTEIQYAQLHGFPNVDFRQIHLPAEAESTRTEAQFIGNQLRAQGVHKILLVTSNYHTKRAAYFWRTVNPFLDVKVVPSVDPMRLFTPETWWKTRAGQKFFLYEWLKTISVKLGL